MALENIYDEVNLKNESKSSGTDTDIPEGHKRKITSHQSNLGFSILLLVSLLIFFLLLAVFFSVSFIILFQKCSHLVEEKKTMKELNHRELECIKDHSLMEGKVWSCCPKNWKSFSSHCYFFSTDSKSWSKSEEDCSRMQAHLLVVNTKEEQDFVIKNAETAHAYYVGLSDPEGQNHWQWVDQTPYNQSATFWHSGDTNDTKEHCVMLNYQRGRWGWNDVLCDGVQRSICEMMKIYF